MAGSIYDYLISQLQSEAKPRPDLLGTGVSPATYMGRLIVPGMTNKDVLSQLPTQSAEEGSKMLSGLGLAGSGTALAGSIPGRVSKAELRAGIRPSVQIAEIAKRGATPLSEYHKMWPAWINETTGEVRHAMSPIGAGWHEPNTPRLFDNATKSLKPDPNWTRGHVDPLTFKAFTESHLEGNAQQSAIQRMRSGNFY